jgi:predicted methyltransferase
MFNMAGELYSTSFYRQMLRVLRPTGRLYHYIGNPTSKSGRSVTRGAMRRLHEAGFRRIKRYPAAFGLIAYK